MFVANLNGIQWKEKKWYWKFVQRSQLKWWHTLTIPWAMCITPHPLIRFWFVNVSICHTVDHTGTDNEKGCFCTFFLRTVSKMIVWWFCVWNYWNSFDWDENIKFFPISIRWLLSPQHNKWQWNYYCCWMFFFSSFVVIIASDCPDNQKLHKKSVHDTSKWEEKWKQNFFTDKSFYIFINKNGSDKRLDVCVWCV